MWDGTRGGQSHALQCALVYTITALRTEEAKALEDRGSKSASGQRKQTTFRIEEAKELEDRGSKSA
jgi:hypothetical protein